MLSTSKRKEGRKERQQQTKRNGTYSNRIVRLLLKNLFPVRGGVAEDEESRDQTPRLIELHMTNIASVIRTVAHVVLGRIIPATFHLTIVWFIQLASWLTAGNSKSFCERSRPSNQGRFFRHSRLLGKPSWRWMKWLGVSDKATDYRQKDACIVFRCPQVDWPFQTPICFPAVKQGWILE
jgi:hypothetical protein